MQYSKLQFKRIVKTKIRELNKAKLLEQVRSRNYKKIDFDKISSNNFEQKPYLSSLSVPDARLRFKIVGFMTPTVRMNFKSDKHFANKLWACQSCLDKGGIGVRDTQHHILICPAYDKLRQGKDLHSDADLVDYFKSGIDMKMKSA